MITPLICENDKKEKYRVLGELQMIEKVLLYMDDGPPAEFKVRQPVEYCNIYLHM